MRHRTILGILVAVLCFQFSPVVRAGELVISTASLHFHNNGEHNNVNPGLFYRFDNQFIVGAYNNSHRKLSTFWAYSIPIHSLSPRLGGNELTLGVILGVVTGYEEKKLQPAVLLNAEYPIGRLWGNRNLTMHLDVMPKDRGALSLSFGYKF